MVYEINYDKKLKDTEEKNKRKKTNSKSKSAPVIDRKEVHG